MFDHFGRITCHDAVRRDILGYNRTSGHDAVSADVYTRQNFTTKTQPALIFNDNRAFGDKPLSRYRHIDILVSVAVVGNVYITGKEDVFSNLNTVYCRQAGMFTYPRTVSDNDFRIVGYTIVVYNWSEKGVCSNADPVTDIDALWVVKFYPPPSILM